MLANRSAETERMCCPGLGAGSPRRVAAGPRGLADAGQCPGFRESHPFIVTGSQPDRLHDFQGPLRQERAQPHVKTWFGVSGQLQRRTKPA